MAVHRVETRSCDGEVTKGRTSVPCPGEVVAPNEQFSVGGKVYVLDLCQKHLDEFNTSFVRWIERSRRGEAVEQQVRKALRGRKGPFTAKEAREWALAQGRDVSESGRLPQSIIEEYAETH